MASSSQPNTVTNREEGIKRLAADIKDIHIAMLTTSDPDGVLRSRPMATQKTEFDGQLWFFTSTESGKVHSIEADQHVNLGYAHPGDNKYISVSGRANIVQDRAKMEELWSPMLKAWFPKGIDDPQIGLIRVDVEGAEIWDAPHGKVVQLIGLAKALVTGKPYEGEGARHERVDLQH